MSSAQAIAVWAVSACAVLGILARPFRTPEWLWAVAGATLLVVCRLVDPRAALGAIGGGADVYAFLIGILTISELARSFGVFDWLAVHVVGAARGSRSRLFGLLFAAGAAVTALLSNDTTVVVLTPAVLAVLARTDAEPLPYLYACAFVANAASFILPISNPANLVLFGGSLPALVPWLATFGVSAAAAVVMTYAVLRLGIGGGVAGRFAERSHAEAPRVPAVAVTMLGLSTLALLVATLCGVDIGYTALGAAVVSVAVMAFADRTRTTSAVRHVAWQVVPLVAGLFVIVAALDRSGAVATLRTLLTAIETHGALAALFLAGAGVTLAANIFNNLPIAMLAGATLHGSSFTPHLARVMLVAVDLGPNLSVTGSLATLLWLIVLRRDGIEVTSWQFMRTGAIVLAPALLAALLLVR